MKLCWSPIVFISIKWIKIWFVCECFSYHFFLETAWRESLNPVTSWQKLIQVDNPPAVLHTCDKVSSNSLTNSIKWYAKNFVPNYWIPINFDRSSYMWIEFFGRVLFLGQKIFAIDFIRDNAMVSAFIFLESIYLMVVRASSFVRDHVWPHYQRWSIKTIILCTVLQHRDFFNINSWSLWHKLDIGTL